MEIAPPWGTDGSDEPLVGPQRDLLSHHSDVICMLIATSNLMMFAVG